MGIFLRLLVEVLREALEFNDICSGMDNPVTYFITARRTRLSRAVFVDYSPDFYIHISIIFFAVFDKAFLYFFYLLRGLSPLC